ncbi:uncharacterized protein LOC131996061 [Stomoxys calcitrans]|uniref:uncharacterized protein LOC131996061 n=1 Tax=Stomoxys calcitrans TaxID=35570 RepID=UPI0027E2A587|nr:uncharacterized protein LOC131996061 [Stomoxys calcitrans]
MILWTLIVGSLAAIGPANGYEDNYVIEGSDQYEIVNYDKATTPSYGSPAALVYGIDSHTFSDGSNKDAAPATRSYGAEDVVDENYDMGAAKSNFNALSGGYPYTDMSSYAAVNPDLIDFKYENGYHPYIASADSSPNSASSYNNAEKHLSINIPATYAHDPTKGDYKVSQKVPLRYINKSAGGANEAYNAAVLSSHSDAPFYKPSAYVSYRSNTAPTHNTAHGTSPYSTSSTSSNTISSARNVPAFPSSSYSRPYSAPAGPLYETSSNVPYTAPSTYTSPPIAYNTQASVNAFNNAPAATLHSNHGVPLYYDQTNSATPVLPYIPPAEPLHMMPLASTYSNSAVSTPKGSAGPSYKVISKSANYNAPDSSMLYGPAPTLIYGPHTSTASSSYSVPTHWHSKTYSSAAGPTSTPNVSAISSHASENVNNPTTYVSYGAGANLPIEINASSGTYNISTFPSQYTATVSSGSSAEVGNLFTYSKPLVYTNGTYEVSTSGQSTLTVVSYNNPDDVAPTQSLYQGLDASNQSDGGGSSTEDSAPSSMFNSADFYTSKNVKSAQPDEVTKSNDTKDYLARIAYLYGASGGYSTSSNLSDTKSPFYNEPKENSYRNSSVLGHDDSKEISSEEPSRNKSQAVSNVSSQSSKSEQASLTKPPSYDSTQSWTQASNVPLYGTYRTSAAGNPSMSYQESSASAHDKLKETTPGAQRGFKYQVPTDVATQGYRLHDSSYDSSQTVHDKLKEVSYGVQSGFNNQESASVSTQASQRVQPTFTKSLSYKSSHTGSQGSNLASHGAYWTSAGKPYMSNNHLVHDKPKTVSFKVQSAINNQESSDSTPQNVEPTLTKSTLYDSSQTKTYEFNFAYPALTANTPRSYYDSSASQHEDPKEVLSKFESGFKYQESNGSSSQSASSHYVKTSSYDSSPTGFQGSNDGSNGAYAASGGKPHGNDKPERVPSPLNNQESSDVSSQPSTSVQASKSPGTQESYIASSGAWAVGGDYNCNNLRTNISIVLPNSTTISTTALPITKQYGESTLKPAYDSKDDTSSLAYTTTVTPSINSSTEKYERIFCASAAKNYGQATYSSKAINSKENSHYSTPVVPTASLTGGDYSWGFPPYHSNVQGPAAYKFPPRAPSQESASHSLPFPAYHANGQIPLQYKFPGSYSSYDYPSYPLYTTKRYDPFYNGQSQGSYVDAMPPSYLPNQSPKSYVAPNSVGYETPGARYVRGVQNYESLIGSEQFFMSNISPHIHGNEVSYIPTTPILQSTVPLPSAVQYPPPFYPTSLPPTSLTPVSLQPGYSVPVFPYFMPQAAISTREYVRRDPAGFYNDEEQHLYSPAYSPGYRNHDYAVPSPPEVGYRDYRNYY